MLRQESAWIGLQATNCSDVGGTQQAIYSDLDAGGSVTGAGVLSDFSPGRGPDGMAIDQDGNIYRLFPARITNRHHIAATLCRLGRYCPSELSD